jgi:hypothetical protein
MLANIEPSARALTLAWTGVEFLSLPPTLTVYSGVTHPMKRSTQVATPLLAATALALLSGCRGPQMQRCVDENNKIVDQSFCRDQNQQPQNNSITHIPTFHYYYGGYGSFAPGTIATGGSLTPASGVSYSTTRGGFGSSFFSGGGEGEGHGGGTGE